MADNTVQAYGRDLDRFATWAALVRFHAYTAPTLKDLARYVGFLHDEQLAPPSIARHLVALKMEALAHSTRLSAPKKKDSGPFAPFPRPAGSILTGDFNMRPEDPLVGRLAGAWQDAWTVANPGKPHPPTFGVFDKEFASEPYCCDFVFVSDDLAKRVASARVDQQNQASDHQPVIVELR
jgi:endonuclease/exonuclease/phosphatase family metal-dependent hydrolase